MGSHHSNSAHPIHYNRPELGSDSDPKGVHLELSIHFAFNKGFVEVVTTQGDCWAARPVLDFSQKDSLWPNMLRCVHARLLASLHR